MEDQIKETVDEIFELYRKHGSEDYIGEDVSQIEHMTQAGILAEEQGYDDEVILGAFFHDFGHLCAHKTKDNDMGGYGVANHESLGANYLRERGFSEKIATLVENHVEAKRYLTFKNPEYYERLSPASKQTLKYQGGPMTAEEAAKFEANPHFELIIKMREWDELAKETDVPVPDLSKYENMCINHLQNSKLNK